MTTTLANLRTEVTAFVDNHPMRQSALASGDGTKTVFMLPDGNIDDGTVVVAVDDVAKSETTDWTMDYNTGQITFGVAPSDGSENVDITYYTTPFTETQIDYSINRAIYKVWPKLAIATLDTSTITLSSTTYEYELPAACNYLKKVEYRSSSTSMYGIEHNWRVINNGATRYLKLYNPSSTGTLRLHYISNPVELSAADDVLETDALIPTRGKTAIVYYAAADLKRTQYMRRSQTNMFHNAEKQNAVKMFELQRVINDMEAMGRIELDLAMTTPRTGTF